MEAKNKSAQDVRNFMRLVGTPVMCLYGGAAVDRALNPDSPIMDYDLAIEDPDEYTRVVTVLKNLGYDVGNTRIAFNMATVAKDPKTGMVWDLSCMDIKSNGIFNYEKFYVKFSPEFPYGEDVDQYDTLNAVRAGRVEIINDPDKEQAYDLLRRFSVLAGKYEFSLDLNGINADTMEIIHRRLRETPLGRENVHARVRCLSRFIGAILRAKKQGQYVAGMGQTGLMCYAFPEINNVLCQAEFAESLANSPAIDKIDLLNRMYERSEFKRNFLSEISLLLQRERDREDPHVFELVEGWTKNFKD